MKNRNKLIFTCLLASFLVACSDEKLPEVSSNQLSNKDSPLEYKITSIDAGRWVALDDYSVNRARELLTATEKTYSIPKETIADMAAKAKELAQEKGLSVNISELLDLTLITCNDKCNRDQFVENISEYITVRANTGLSHQQAIHGQIIIQNLAKRPLQ